ncbi:MAG: transcriptional repressor [Deltaproteobacteria bacterium]|nr:transcriptional repressor [Deltaproteobacteria bacterium]
MCNQCNYEEMLIKAGLEASSNRIAVLEVIGSNPFPLSAADIYKIIERSGAINQVTVYRILDLLVDHHVAERISTGGRAFYYGLAPNENHKPHPHFYCKSCGQMVCLSPDSLKVDADTFMKIFPGRVDKMEVRIDGICKNCEKGQTR